MNILRNAQLLFTAATLLATTAALGQSSATKQSTPHRDAASGMATGRRMHKPLTTAPQSGSMENTRTNPMHEEKPMSGQNPLYGSKDKALQPGQHSGKAEHEVIEYKDGDDPVMHRKDNTQASARKSGAVVSADYNPKARAAARHAAPYASGTTNHR